MTATKYQIVGDFSGTQYGGTPTWSDITPIVAAGGDWDALTITKWRQDNVSDPTPTQVTFKVFNPDGRMTPGYTGLVLNLLTPDVAAPGCVSDAVAAFAAQGSSSVGHDATGQVGPNPNSLKISIPSGVPSLSNVADGATVAATAGLVYSLACGINNTGTVAQANLNIQWLNSGGGVISTVLGSGVAHGAIGTAQVVNKTAPAGTVALRFLWSTNAGATTASTVWYVSNLEVEQAATVAGEQVAPYYPGVRRRARTQVRAVVGGTTVDVGDTFADSWSVQQESSTNWSTEYNGTDILGRMGADTPLQGFITEEIVNNDSPAYLYQLQEAAGATTFGDFTAQHPPATIGNSSTGAGVVEAGDTASGTNPFIAGNIVAVTNAAYPSNASQTPGSWLELPNVLTSGAGWTSMWVQMPSVAPIALGSGPESAAIFYTGIPGTGYELQVRPGGVLLFTLNGGSIDTSVDYCDGNMHHVLCQLLADNKTLQIWVDGVLAAASTAGSPFASYATGLPLYLGMQNELSSQWSPFTGGYAFVAQGIGALSSARVMAHYLAGSTAFAGERTDTHIARLLSYRKNLGSVLDVGNGYVGSQDVLGTTLADALTQTSDVEGGFIFADGQGRITFRNRGHLFNPTSAYTLDALQGHVDDTTIVTDDIQYMLNDVSITTPDGATQRYFDPPSVEQDGEATADLTLNIDTDSHALDAAGWMVSYGKQEWIGLPSLDVDLMKIDDATKLAVLSLQPLDEITLINFAEPLGPSRTVSLLVEGVTLNIASTDEVATLFCSPVPPIVFAWDSDAAHGWDSSAVWAY
jgi:hypothetical protein